MTSYTAGLRHHSISRSRTVTAASLASAKRKAARAFGGERQDYEIVIYEERAECAPEIVARRSVGGRRWQDR